MTPLTPGSRIRVVTFDPNIHTITIPTIYFHNTISQPQINHLTSYSLRERNQSTKHLSLLHYAYTHYQILYYITSITLHGVTKVIPKSFITDLLNISTH